MVFLFSPIRESRSFSETKSFQDSTAVAPIPFPCLFLPVCSAPCRLSFFITVYLSINLPIYLSFTYIIIIFLFDFVLALIMHASLFSHLFLSHFVLLLSPFSPFSFDTLFSQYLLLLFLPPLFPHNNYNFLLFQCFAFHLIFFRLSLLVFSLSSNDLL